MSDRTERATPTAARPLAGQRVLAMEDEPLVSLMMVAMLQDAGAEVVSASAEEEALSALQAMRFDRAVLDVNLHGQAVRAVPAALAREGIPFLFVTGYGRAGLPPGYEQAPALSKPFDNRRLVEAVGALDRPAEGVVRLRS